MKQEQQFFSKNNFTERAIQIRTFLNKVGASIGLPKNTIKPLDAIFIIILLVGIFARTWEFGVLPPGLHPDEVSTALEAYDLYHFGVDRNGFSYPVQFVSWGSGMNALVYAYVLIPFIAIDGLKPMIVRLPMLISGILIVPLAYFVARQTLGKKLALIAVFFIAISPWHILQSRWGHDANLLPFTFLVAYVCLLKSRINNKWFILATIFFALSMYVYGPAYAAVPVFFAYSLPVLSKSGRVSKKNLILGLLIFAIMSIPLGLLLSFNALHLDTLHLGVFTIPRLPSQPRYESMSVFFNGGLLPNLIQNVLWMFIILTTQVDGVWTTVVPYGYFYTVTFPLAALGAVCLLRKLNKTPEQILLLGWIAAVLAVGVIVHINFNNINIIFTPLIFCITISLAWMGKRIRSLPTIVICALFIAFVVFTKDYHSEVYRQRVGREFFSAGLLPAINFANQSHDNPICITDSIKMPYIYVLFSEKMNPADYLNDIEYVDPSEPFKRVRSLGRYSFGLANCSNDPKTIYILLTEQPPIKDIDYKIKSFDSFRVYTH